MSITNMLSKINPFQSDFDTFNKAINESNQIIQEIKSKCDFNQQILDNINKISNDPTMITNVKNAITNPSAISSGIDKPFIYQSMTEVAKEQSKWKILENIGDFCSGVMWIFQNPYECFKLILTGVSDIVGIGAMVVCAAAILMAIFGHEEALKYIPIVMVIHILLKLVVFLL